MAEIKNFPGGGGEGGGPRDPRETMKNRILQEDFGIDSGRFLGAAGFLNQTYPLPPGSKPPEKTRFILKGSDAELGRYIRDASDEDMFKEQELCSWVLTEIARRVDTKLKNFSDSFTPDAAEDPSVLGHEGDAGFMNIFSLLSWGEKQQEIIRSRFNLSPGFLLRAEAVTLSELEGMVEKGGYDEPWEAANKGLQPGDAEAFIANYSDDHLASLLRNSTEKNWREEAVRYGALFAELRKRVRAEELNAANKEQNRAWVKEMIDETQPAIERMMRIIEDEFKISAETLSALREACWNALRNMRAEEYEKGAKGVQFVPNFSDEELGRRINASELTGLERLEAWEREPAFFQAMSDEVLRRARKRANTSPDGAA